MRARLIILLAALSTSFGHARADVPAPPAETRSESEQAARDESIAAPTAPAYPPLEEDVSLSASPERAPSSHVFVHPTVDGLLGGVHVVEAASAWPGTFRVALVGQLFNKNGFIAKGDHHRHGGGVLIANVTPIEHLELAARVATYTTANRTTDPDVIQVIGDVHLHAKGYGRLFPWLAVGGDVDVALLNGVGEVGVQGSATSVGLRGNASFDLRGLKKPIPLLARVNLRYDFDNSARLIRDVEDARYDALANPSPRDVEYRNLVSPAERYALQINRLDRLGAAFGFELPYSPYQRVYLHPLVEWRFALPINRQDYGCVVTRIPGQESCLAQEGFGARPSVLTLGVRAQPYVPGLALLFAVDIATTGSRTFVRELAPTERYLLQFGISYAYDPRPRPPPRSRVVRVEVPTPEVRAHVTGLVVDAETGTPVMGAIVHFEGTSLSDLITDAEGAFKSAELAPGPQGMRIHAEGYREALCVAVVASSGGDVSARCELTPSVRYGAIAGRIVDATGTPIAGARLVLRGPAELTLDAGSDGNFQSDRIPQGEYEAEAQAENYFPRRAHVNVLANQRGTLGFTLYVRSRTPQVRIKGARIALAKPLAFVEGSAQLDAKSEPLVLELVDLLRAHPELTHVEIQGHVDPGADAAAAQQFSHERALAVRSALIEGGIAPARLEAVGYGATRPLVPNITAANRARNRRIELVIK